MGLTREVLWEYEKWKEYPTDLNVIWKIGEKTNKNWK